MLFRMCDRRYSTRPLRLWIILASCFAGFSGLASGQHSFTTYDDVTPVLPFVADALPAALKSTDSAVQGKVWPDWIIAHDRDVRGRLLRGDEDTVVNWLLFGRSFTKEPRVLFDLPPASNDLTRVISRRTTDLIAALTSRHPDERSLFARQLLAREGYKLDDARSRARLQKHFQDEIQRVLAERQQYAHREASFRPGDFADQMMVQSHLFQDRGLSLDTSILPSFALEQALETMKNQGLLPANSVRRVALIGPGLDFADKSSGYDFYPVQTLQPFSSIDSLLRLGLASGPGEIELTTLDISSRVNDHILSVRNRGRAGIPYVLRLPMEPASPWSPSLVGYWKHLGDHIASELPEVKPLAANKGVEVRVIEIRPQIAAAISAEDFNVVTERWTGPPFDLVIATNVFVYYDKLDQSLALAGIEAMLRPGGFFLTNNAIVELPESQLRSQGFITVRDSAEISDHVFWYCRIL